MKKYLINAKQPSPAATCYHCGRITARDHYQIGADVACPYCNQTFTVAYLEPHDYRSYRCPECNVEVYTNAGTGEEVACPKCAVVSLIPELPAAPTLTGYVVP